MTGESAEARATRLRQRSLFDTVAGRYQASRQDCSEEMVRWMVATAGLTTGARVLEIGCGTGQLTRVLTGFPLQVTAIDIGPAMITAARRSVADGRVRFEVSSFEDFAAPPGSFDLIVSATAFHWLDPELRWTKAVELLGAGGWLSVASIREVYDEPFGQVMHEIWIAHSRDGGAWATAKPPTTTEEMEATGLFRDVVARSADERTVLSRETVAGVERTRATYLSYDGPTRASFDAALDAALEGLTEIGTAIRSEMTMGRAGDPEALQAVERNS